jgi:D-alanyl-D-alanine carboxypeptidase
LFSKVLLAIQCPPFGSRLDKHHLQQTSLLQLPAKANKTISSRCSFNDEIPASKLQQVAAKIFNNPTSTALIKGISMKINNKNNVIKSMFFLGFTFALAACGGSSGSDDKKPTTKTAPVIALAAHSIKYMQSARVTLAASISDQENNVNSIKWTMLSSPEGAEVNIEDSTKQKTQFLAPNVLGEYKFSLTATDSDGLESSKEMLVNIVSLEEYLVPRLEELIKNHYQEHKELVSNMALRVNFEEFDFVWQSAVGLADVSEEVSMTVNDPFRIASVSKNITAATALKLIELGYFTLDTPIGDILADTDLPEGYTVDDLHVKDGIKRGKTITIRQLMDHSSGMENFISYLEDPESPDYLEFDSVLLNGPSAQPELWTPHRILSNILDRGLTKNLDTLPGEAFLYSNTGTYILGFIIEKVTNTPLHDAMTEHVFMPLNMDSTYMDVYQQSSATPVDHLFNIDESEYSDSLPAYMYGNHNLMELGMSISYCPAGNAVISTLADLDRFYTALKHNTFIVDEALQQELHDWAIDDGEGGTYGLGLDMGSEVFGTSNHSYTYRGHTGIWGVVAFDYQPINVRIISWVNQANIDADLTVEVLELLDGIGFKYTSF